LINSSFKQKLINPTRTKYLKLFNMTSNIEFVSQEIPPPLFPRAQYFFKLNIKLCLPQPITIIIERLKGAALEDIKIYGSQNQTDKFCHKAGKFCNPANSGKKAETNRFPGMTKYLFDFSKLFFI